MGLLNSRKSAWLNRVHDELPTQRFSDAGVTSAGSTRWHGITPFYPDDVLTSDTDDQSAGEAQLQEMQEVLMGAHSVCVPFPLRS